MGKTKNIKKPDQRPNKSQKQHEQSKTKKSQKKPQGKVNRKPADLSSAKAVFRVDDGRAMKAKKNKAVVKFQKARQKNRTAETISQVNSKMDNYRSGMNTFQKPMKTYVNPFARANEQQEKTSNELEAAIHRMGSL